MVWFEVYIPGKAGNPNVTLTVEAANWIGALRTGLSNLGEGQEAIANVMCDIKEDNSIHVTDVTTHRVFRLREVAAPATPAGRPSPPPVSIPDAPPEEELATQPMAQPAPMAPIATPPVPPAPMIAALMTPSPMPPSPLPMPPPPQEPEHSVPWTPMQAPDASATVEIPIPKMEPPPSTKKTQKVPQPPVEPTERVERSPAKSSGPVKAPTARGATAPKRTSGQFDQAPQPAHREESLVPQPAPIGRAAAVPPAAIADAVADVFDATQDLLLEAELSPMAVAERLLDIALTHAPAESGSFYLADVNGHELHFAAVRGPKAKEIQQRKLTVKVGQGIVGFCAQEGVCLSVSDIQKDPRYFSAVADAIGYQPRDTVCASAEKDGRLFGALQLINSTSGFTPVHMEVLRYIGLTAASLLERHFETH